MEKELKAFRKLIVRQRAHELTLMTHKESGKFPKDEILWIDRPSPPRDCIRESFN